MSVKHKWHKEIKAWADGAEIEYKDTHYGWMDVREPSWSTKHEYRIKPQPKEPQYLYVSKGEDGRPEFSFLEHQEVIGKIKLEPEYE